MDKERGSTHLKDCQYNPCQPEKSPPPTPKVALRKEQEEMAGFGMAELGV